MKQRNALTTRTLWLVPFVLIAAVGCTETQGTAFDEQAQSLIPKWTFCANAGEHCSFTGTRGTRFGRDGRYVYATKTDGIHCSASSYKSASLYPTGNVCEVDMAGATTTPTPAPTPTDSGTTAPDPHAMHATDGGTAMPMGDMSLGPFIDHSVPLPTGSAGFSTTRLRSTSEQPAPGDGTGAYRTVCDFSHMSYDDPLVFPGQQGAAHLHTYFGNTRANFASTPESIRSTGNSTCRGGIANRTAYWVPALLTNKGIPVVPSTSNIYYKSGYHVSASTVKPFPQGLRMLAGDAKTTGPQSGSHTWWECSNNSAMHHSSIPSCPVGANLTFVLYFPQCWDGTNLDSANHKTHMAYPSGRSCPSTHPIALPEVSYHVVYKVPSAGTAGMRLSSDMYPTSSPGGYSIHGDWMEGWDPAVVKSFVANCVAKPRDCHSHLLGDGREQY